MITDQEKQFWHKTGFQYGLQLGLDLGLQMSTISANHFFNVNRFRAQQQQQPPAAAAPDLSAKVVDMNGDLQGYGHGIDFNELVSIIKCAKALPDREPAEVLAIFNIYPPDQRA